MLVINLFLLHDSTQPTQPLAKDKTRDVDIVEQLDPSLGIGFGPKLIFQKVDLL